VHNAVCKLVVAGGVLGFGVEGGTEDREREKERGREGGREGGREAYSASVLHAVEFLYASDSTIITAYAFSTADAIASSVDPDMLSTSTQTLMPCLRRAAESCSTNS
jgi:hypothetical protein